MGLSIGPVIGVEGADKFQLAFREMTATAAMMQSQMDALTATFKDNDSAMKTNKAVSEQLTKQVFEQRQVYDKATEGYTMAEKAMIDAAKAIPQAKKEYEAAVPVLEIFKQQYAAAVEIEERQRQVVADVAARLQEEIGVKQMLTQEYERGIGILQTELDLHAQEIAKGSELVTNYEQTKTAYEENSRALEKYVNELSKENEKHLAYSAQMDTTLTKLVALQEQHDKMVPQMDALIDKYVRAKERADALAEAYGKTSPQAQGAAAAVKQLEFELKTQSDSFKALSREIEKTEATLTNLEKKDGEVQKTMGDLEAQCDRLGKTVDESEQEFRDAEDALNAEKQAVQEATKAVEEFEKQHGEASDEQKQAQKNIDDLNASLKQETAELKENAAETKAHKRALNEATREVDSLETSISKAEKRFDLARIALSKWEDVMFTAKAKLEELEKKLRESKDTMFRFGEATEKNGEEIEKFGESVSKVLAPLTALTAFSGKSALTFTDALAKISTIADTSKVSLDEFGDGIKKMASETGFATEDIAAATYQALSAAVDTEDALEFVQGAADLARAGFLDMYGSVDVLTTLLNAYGKNVSEVSHLSDVLVKVQDMGKTTVDQLAQSMGNVIPTAAQYGISVEDLGAAYVVLTRQGINTARSTTYLRSAFTELEKESSDAAKALKKATNKSFMQLMKEGKSLGEVMQALRDSVNGDEEAFIHLFGSVRTAAGALALANTSAYEYAQILDEVSNSNGQAARNVEKLQTPTLQMKKAWEQLKTSAIELGQQMIELLAPAMKKVLDWVRKGTEWFKGLNKSTKMVIATFTGVLGVTGPAIVLFGKLVKGLGKAIKTIRLVAAGMATLGTTLSVVGAVIGVVVAGAMAYSVKLSEQRAEALKAREAEWGLTESMKEHIDKNKELITQSQDVRSSSEEQARSNLAQAQTAQTLLEQLRGLYDENGKVKKGEELRAEFIRTQLADALGIELESLDKLIAKNGIYSDSIDKVIEKKLQEANAEAYTEGYKKQIEAISELQVARDQAFADFEAQTQKEKEAREAAQTAFDEYKKAEESGLKGDALKVYADKWAELQTNYLIAARDTETAKQSYEDLDRAIEEGTGTLDFFQKKIMEASGMSAEEVDKAMKSASASVDLFKDDNKEKFDQIVADEEQAMKDYQQKIDDARTPVGEKAKAVSDTAKENLKTDASPEGEGVTDSFGLGMTNAAALQRLRAHARALRDVVIGELDDAYRFGSPSKVMMEKGNFVSEGFAIGITDGLGDVVRASNLLSQAAMLTGGFTSRYPGSSAGGYSAYNKSISAPISLTVNVNGSVDDPQKFTDMIEERLVDLIVRNERVFA